MPSVRTQSLPRRFFERYQVEHLALCRSLSLSDSERQTCASVLLHRLMFLCFLRAGGLLQSELYSVRRELLAPGKDRSRGTTLVRVFDPAIWSTDLASKLAVSEANWHRLIAFCDAFVWRLDDESPGPDEITPDMLGVLFEKHVNQKQTGAYYTKPDITSYLAESTILPRVLDMAREHCPAAFRPGGPVWGLLRKYPDRYIRAAVRHRSALPTETQPELLARHRRCGDLRKHLRSGAVEQSNDLVTLNLDPGRLAGDLIRESEDRELLRALRQAVENITVLDPTCGSGAFLLAALTVLEDLALACLQRSETRMGRDEVRLGILSRNLFGVDLMPEALELCRMRLLLRLAASIPPGENTGPLPALAATLRTGNALVGLTRWPESHREAASKNGRLDPDHPFHWPAEFPEVMSHGGFDVIIGNPPYLPAHQVQGEYTVPGYVTAGCPDVYAWVMERSAELLRAGGRCALLVPLSLGFSRGFAACRKLLFESYGDNWFASFGRIPSALFDFDVRVRNTIHIGHKSGQPGRQHTTRLHRWFEAARPHLFELLEYVPFHPELWHDRIPKLNTAPMAEAMERCLEKSGGRLGNVLSPQRTDHRLYFKKTAYNWLTFCRRLPPCYDAAGNSIAQTQFDAIHFSSAWQRDAAMLLLNGKWAYAFWSAVGDDFHVTRWMFAEFPIDLNNLPVEARRKLTVLARQLEASLGGATAFKRNAGKRVGTWNLARCRSRTDRSDRIFAEHLGLEAIWNDIELLQSQVVKTDFDIP